MIETSFILLKPDAYKNENIILELNKDIQNENLIKNETVKVLLSHEIIDGLWPAYKNCPITKAFMYKYFNDKILDIWIITGEDVNEILKKIKRQIRKKYSHGCFANVLHTPVDAFEAEWQMQMLRGIQGKHENVPNNLIDNFVYEGMFGKALKIDNKEIINAVNKVWSEKYENGSVINSNIQCNIGEKNYQVILNDENNKTIDYVISALYETISDCKIEELISIVLDVDIKKKAVLLNDTLEHCSNIYKKLKDIYGLNVILQGDLL